jgi:allantoinase
MYDLVIRGATIVTIAGQARADLAITDGRVAGIGTGLVGGADEIDATGLHLFPGAIDPHVHFREPGLTHKEDFESGTRAAAFGGVTTVFDMPNTTPATATVEILAAKRDLVGRHAHIDFGLFGIILPENQADLAPMAGIGAIGFKLFLGETTGGNPCPDDGAIFQAFRTIAGFGGLAAVHAENNPILQTLKHELRATGRTDARAHLESRPAFVEAEAIDRAATIAQAAGCRLHVVHVSSAEGLDRVRAARARGANVTGEALIAHLLLDDAVYATHGNLALVNPPIRERRHPEALWRGIADGSIDFIATDHAPHTLEEQSRPNVWQGVGGFAGVETFLPLLLSQVAAGRLSLEDVARLTSARAAQVYGLWPRKGSLAIGADADIALVDLKHRWRIDARDMHAKHPISPFEGWEITGKPIGTIVRGTPVVRDGAIVSPPTGQFLAPARA